VITSVFDATSVGKEYRVKVTALNIEGETDSDIANIILGERPSAPLTMVAKDQAQSSSSTLHIVYDAVTSQ